MCTRTLGDRRCHSVEQRNRPPGAIGLSKSTTARRKAIVNRCRAASLSALHHPPCCEHFRSGRCVAAMGKVRKTFEELTVCVMEHQAIYSRDPGTTRYNLAVLFRYFPGCVDEIDPDAVQAFVAARKAERRTGATINRQLATLSRGLSLAIRKGWHPGPNPVRAIQRLREASLPYMVTGSMAVSLYGLPRMTRDIDIVLEVRQDQVGKISRLFEKDFYVDPQAVREAIARRGIFNIIHNATVIKVDFIVRKDEPYRKEEFRRRRNTSVDGVEVFLVAPEDLVLSKLAWAKDSRSEMHLGDVKNILKSGMQLDYAYIEKWAKELSVFELYRDVAG